MFIGHYAAAPIGAAKGQIKLWHGFLAVQLVDFAWAIFILLGVEKARIVPGLTEASPLDLHFMPYTHSLLFTLIWAVLGAVAFKVLTKAQNWTGALIFATLVCSHWLGDVIVHIPDMTWWPGSEKIGFGLWNTVAISLPLELGITGLALAYYLRLTKPVGARARFWMISFIAVLVALQLFSNFGPPPNTIQEAAISAFVAFSVLVFLAARFERTRQV